MRRCHVQNEYMVESIKSICLAGVRKLLGMVAEYEYGEDHHLRVLKIKKDKNLDLIAQALEEPTWPFELDVDCRDFFIGSCV